MVAGNFPGSALLTQLFRQLSKPLSQRIVVYASQHPKFRKNCLIRPGRAYKKLELHVERLKAATPSRMLTRHEPPRPPPVEIKVNDEVAIEVGSQLMIEVVIFALLALLLFLDWLRSNSKSVAEELRRKREFEQLESRKAEIREKLEELERESEVLRSELERKMEERGGESLQDD